jgi:hypothetical protein
LRPRAYFLFELVAWPALVWCGAELVLRLAAGATGGMGSTGLTATCAALTIGAARWRSRQLALAEVAGLST